jgi:hypothetical protein
MKIEYVGDASLDKCYFVGSEGDKKVVIRATQFLDPDLHAKAQEDNDKEHPKLEVQPEDIIKKIERLGAKDLESFKKIAFSMIVNRNGMPVKAAKEDAPVMSTESLEKVKVEKEPTVSVEEQIVAKENATESSPETKKFFGRLPGKATGKPEIALDMQSAQKTIDELTGQIHVLQDEMKGITEQKDKAVKDLSDVKKGGESEKVMKLLSDLGVVEDPKDKETYSKKLVGLNEQALGVLEGVLKDVAAARGGEPRGAPKMGPRLPMGPKGPEGLEGKANLIHANLIEENMGSAIGLSELWQDLDRARETANT